MRLGVFILYIDLLNAFKRADHIELFNSASEYQSCDYRNVIKAEIRKEGKLSFVIISNSSPALAIII